jgi:hypothetical protein
MMICPFEFEVGGHGSSQLLTVLKLGIVVFKVGLGALAPSSDRVCVIFVENTSRRELEEVRTGLLRKRARARSAKNVRGASQATIAYVFSHDEESDTIRPLSIILGVRLSSISDALHNPPDRNWTGVEHPGLHRLLPHKVAFEMKRKRSNMSNRDEVITDCSSG